MPARTLDDVVRELDILKRKVQLLETDDIDMRKRRVVNASPSAKLDDYVIRRELEDFKQLAASVSSVSSGSTSGSAYDRAIFGLGVNTIIDVGTDVTPSHICTFPADTEVARVGKEAKILALFAKAKQPPAGSDLKLELWKNYDQQNLQDHPRELIIDFPMKQGFDLVTLFGPGFEFEFDVTKLIHLDTIHVHVIQVGSQVSGSGVYLKLLYKWL